MRKSSKPITILSRSLSTPHFCKCFRVSIVVLKKTRKAKKILKGFCAAIKPTITGPSGAPHAIAPHTVDHPLNARRGKFACKFLLWQHCHHSCTRYYPRRYSHQTRHKKSLSVALAMRHAAKACNERLQCICLKVQRLVIITNTFRAGMQTL